MNTVSSDYQYPAGINMMQMQPMINPMTSMGMHILTMCTQRGMKADALGILTGVITEMTSMAPPMMSPPPQPIAEAPSIVSKPIEIAPEVSTKVTTPVENSYSAKAENKDTIPDQGIPSRDPHFKNAKLFTPVKVKNDKKQEPTLRLNDDEHKFMEYYNKFAEEHEIPTLNECASRISWLNYNNDERAYSYMTNVFDIDGMDFHEWWDTEGDKNFTKEEAMMKKGFAPTSEVADFHRNIATYKFITVCGKIAAYQYSLKKYNA